MSTVIAAATSAFMAALSAAPAVAPVVDRIRLRPQSDAVRAWVVVRPDGAMAAEKLQTGQVVAWVVQMAVECNAKSTTSMAPDLAVDDLAAATYARLMQDTTLGGAVRHIEPVSVAYDFDVDGEQTSSATFVFRVRVAASAPSVF